jgi:hypothetical protein
VPAAKVFPTAGRRLLSALISYQMRYAGVDRVLKEDADKPAGQFWEDKADELIRIMLAQVSEKAIPDRKGPEIVKTDTKPN